MFFDLPLRELVDRAAAHPDSLRDHYELLFARIADRDAKFHSLCEPTWEWIDAELNRIASLSATGANSGLLGIPVGIKDTIAVSGLPTRAGTRHDIGQILQLAQSPAVTALQQAGAVIVAKQATHQFGSSAGSASTQSCRGSAYFAGGSTVGGAVAVAAGLTRLALGSDAGGSVRQPAAFAGVVGLRPRKGSISDDGQVHGGLFGQSTGLIVCNVEDIAIVFERCPSLWATPPEVTSRARRRPVIGIPDISWTNIAPAAEGALRASCARLRKAGYKLLSTSLWLTEEARADFFLVMNFDNWMFHKALMAGHPEIYDPAVLAVMRAGEAIEKTSAESARRRLPDHRARFIDSALAQGVDILLTPSVPYPDVRKSAGSARELSIESGRFTILSNVYDFDSISVPTDRDRRGWARSVMLHAVNTPLSHLLKCARWLEADGFSVAGD